MKAADQRPVGRFVDVASAAPRPEARDELEAYGVLDLLDGATVIDIGTGDGRLALGAAAAGALSVVGVDPDPDALHAARRRARALSVRRLSFRLGAAQELPVPSQRFDVGLLSWSL